MSTGHPVPPEAVGRTCPYCRVALEEGVGVVFCTSCGAVHHDDCWEENGGCAVALCAGRPPLREDGEERAEPPSAATPPPPAPPAVVEPAGPPPPVAPASASAPPPPPGSPAPGPGRSRRNWIPLIAVVIVLLGGATAGAIVLSGGNENSSTTVETTPAESEFAESEEESFGAEEEFESEEEGFEEEEEEEVEPEPSAGQLARGQVQQALRSHFDDLANGYYNAAYRDLTPTEGAEIGGQSSWVAAQEEDQLQDFDLRVDTELLGAHSARAGIEEFQTRSLANGCQEWSGYWEMSKVYGEWLISAATLESEPC